MANRHRTGRPGNDRHTGWVWVVIGIVAVALIVWWVAAAVDGGDDEVTEGEITSIQETRPAGNEFDDGQIFENGEGAFLEEENQAPRSGQVLGGTPTAGNQLEGQVGQEIEEVEQFTQWAQSREQPQVDEEYTVDGMNQLQEAVGALFDRYGGQPTAGEQAGGGPAGEEAGQLQNYRQQLQDSVRELEQAQEAQQTDVFHQAANTAAQSLQYLQRQAQVGGLDQQVEQLLERVHDIEVDRPLAEQSETVRAYFDESAEVVEQLSQNLQASQGGQQQNPQQQGAGSGQ